MIFSYIQILMKLKQFYFQLILKRQSIQLITLSFSQFLNLLDLAKFYSVGETLFYNAESCVINNGRSTGYFRLERGTRQGDPLSSYLFILALEVLCIQIRENNDIKGIIINNTDIKLSAYADDTYFLASDVIFLNIYSKHVKYSSSSHP